MKDGYARLVQQERDALRGVYGLYMRQRQLAEVLGISTKSLSNTIRRSQEVNIEYLRRNTVRLGRRVRYPVRCVAEALVLNDDELKSRMKEQIEQESANGE